MTTHFVCVWVGEKYATRYPEIWLDMVVRNAALLEEFSVWCLTDRPDEVPQGMMPIAAPDWLPGWWAKVAMFSPAMPWADGDRVVYLDLDVAVTGRLEDLASVSGICRDWHWPCYNSSAMSWLHGEHRDAWDALTPERLTRPAGDALSPLLPEGEINGGDQEHLTEVGGWEYFPAEWFVSYRSAKTWPPNECKAVIFHGPPKPHEVVAGWVPGIWKVGGYTSLPVMGGVNTTHEVILDNVRSAVARDLPWFTGFGPHERKAVLVCGAPSMLDCMTDIRWHARQGALVVSVNNAWRPLLEHGITPGAHVMLDARPENAAFLEGAPEGMKYFLASQCHPDVYEAATGRETVIWHNGFGDNEPLREILQPWWDEGPDQRPCILVPGGGTVGLRALWLLALSGCRTIHVYGMDSSYAESGAHHAYTQAQNDADAVMDVVLMDEASGAEKHYKAARWMVRQSEEFRETWNDLRKEGVTIHVHGVGLLPDIAAQLKREARGL